MKKFLIFINIFLLSHSISNSKQVETIINNTKGKAEIVAAKNDLFIGQSFTTPQGSDYHYITFTWILSDEKTKLGKGYLYLMSDKYFGPSAELNSYTPNVISIAAGIISDTYFFLPAITLEPDKKYWVYLGGIKMRHSPTEKLIQFATSIEGVGYTIRNYYKGGEAYATCGQCCNYQRRIEGDFNFIVEARIINCISDYDNDGDIDGKDLSTLATSVNNLKKGLSMFAEKFGRTDLETNKNNVKMR